MRGLILGSIFVGEARVERARRGVLMVVGRYGVGRAMFVNCPQCMSVIGDDANGRVVGFVASYLFHIYIYIYLCVCVCVCKTKTRRELTWLVAAFTSTASN